VSAAGSRYFRSGCPQHAAGIAYRVLFSLAPLAIVLVSIFGLVLQDDDVRDEVVDRVIGALPLDASGSMDIQNAIESIATPASAAGLVSLIVFFYAASGMMGSLRKGLEAATGVAQGRPVVRAKLIDFALIVGATLFVLASVAIGLVAELANELVAHLTAALGVDTVVEGKGIALALAFLLWMATSLLLYRFVPAAGLRLQDALAGAVVTAIVLLGISLASDIVYAHTTDWSLIYGSLTSLLVFLYSVYLYAGTLLLGAAVAAEWSLPHPSDGLPLRTKIRGAITGLFIRKPKQPPA
jgi:membrane protein